MKATTPFLLSAAVAAAFVGSPALAESGSGGSKEAAEIKISSPAQQILCKNYPQNSRCQGSQISPTADSSVDKKITQSPSTPGSATEEKVKPADSAVTPGAPTDSTGATPTAPTDGTKVETPEGASGGSMTDGKSSTPGADPTAAPPGGITPPAAPTMPGGVMPGK
jgi:hypothetical protein